MKLIVAGSRTISPTIEEIDHYLQWHNLAGEARNFEIVSGTAFGVDKGGENWAKWYNRPLHLFPADWERFGRAAGHIRNKQMADFADALLLVWDGESRGSANMKVTMAKQDKPIYEVVL